MARGRERDEEFGAYVDARWTRLVGAAVLLGCSALEAEDVVQTALTRCLVHWGRVRRADDTDAYVYRVLVNTFTDTRRRRWGGERPHEHLPDRVVPDATDQIVVRDAVERSLGRLSPDHRQAVVLRYFLHLSEEQMADVLDVAAGTVKSRLSRALKVLSTDPDLTDRQATP